MLKWLGGAAKDADAAAHLASVKEMLATLPAEDAVRATQDAVLWLDSAVAETEFTVAHCYDVVDQIDAGLKRHSLRLIDQYLALKPQAKFQEGLLSRAAMSYWTALGNAYLACIERTTDPKQTKSAALGGTSDARAGDANQVDPDAIRLRGRQLLDNRRATLRQGAVRRLCG
jgi:hypothetical protein